MKYPKRNLLQFRVENVKPLFMQNENPNIENVSKIKQFSKIPGCHLLQKPRGVSEALHVGFGWLGDAYQEIPQSKFKNLINNHSQIFTLVF